MISINNILISTINYNDFKLELFYDDNIYNSNRQFIKEIDNIFEQFRTANLEILYQLNNILILKCYFNNQIIDVESFVYEIENTISNDEDYINFFNSIYNSIDEYALNNFTIKKYKVKTDDLVDCLSSTQVLINLYYFLPEEMKKDLNEDLKDLNFNVTTLLYDRLPNKYEQLIEKLLNKEIDYLTFQKYVLTYGLPILKTFVPEIIKKLNMKDLINSSTGNGTGVLTKEQLNKLISSNDLGADEKTDRTSELQSVNKILSRVSKGDFKEYGFNESTFRKDKHGK